MPAENKVLLVVFAIVFAVVLVLGGGYLYLTSTQSTGTLQDSLRETFNLPAPAPVVSAPTPVPTPRPIKPLPSGKQEYNLSHGSSVTGPKPFKIIVDPLTPQKGQKQTVQAMLTSDVEVSEAKIILHTDNTKKEYLLKLIDGNTQNGTWEASWAMEDTYDYNYYIQFYLKSANGTFQNGLRFRQDY